MPGEEFVVIKPGGEASPWPQASMMAYLDKIETINPVLCNTCTNFYTPLCQRKDQIEIVAEMSRQSMASQRNLTLTEELEKLEQSITLTLQEIDHNFSRAHRIVTSSILPVVEKYAEHSKDVWESSKFWKQFFEASANVSLSGYEEPPEQEETVTEDAAATAPSTPAYDSPSQAQDSEDNTVTPKTNPRHQFQSTTEDSLLSTPLEESTPRPRAKHGLDQEPSMALYSSPYETLRREIKGDQQPSHDDNSTLPSTPRNRSPSQLDSSPFIAPSTSRPHRTPKDDPLLHRILDKNWRLQATPHTTTRAPKPGTSNLPYRSGRTPARNRNDNDATPAQGKGKTKPTAADDDDLDSSPAMPAPQLHSEIFGTPAQRKTVPGVSVLTPARGKRTPSQQRAVKTPSEDTGRRGIWESNSDDEDEGLGMSPPKTMQFHVPQSKLLRTPAREASKKIVEDLLLTAGGNVTDEFDESSPSVVKRGIMDEDDTF